MLKITKYTIMLFQTDAYGFDWSFMVLFDYRKDGRYNRNCFICSQKYECNMHAKIENRKAFGYKQ